MIFSKRIRTPWALYGVWVVAVTVAGVVFGAARGLDYLPTLPFALIEGGIVFGVPGAVIGLLMVGLWFGGDALVHMSRRRADPTIAPDPRA